MKLFQHIFLTLFLLFSVPSVATALTPFQESCFNGQNDIGWSNSVSWPGYLLRIRSMAATGRDIIISSVDNRPGFPHLETCMIWDSPGGSPRTVQCVGCANAPEGNLQIELYDGTNFKLVDDRWFAESGDFIPPDCILKPIDIYFANGIFNDQRNAARSLRKLQKKTEKQLAKQNITNDTEANPSCSDISFKTLFHDHTMGEVISNKLQLANRSVEEFDDPVVFEEAYKETVPNLIDPASVEGQALALETQRDGQQVSSIIIAHSQGNKTANTVYELASAENKPGTIALGTMEPYVADGSDHITSTNDTVVNSWVSYLYSLLGRPLPLPGNIVDTDIPLDIQHTFDYYLKEGSPARQALCDRIDAEFAKPGFVGPIP